MKCPTKAKAIERLQKARSAIPGLRQLEFKMDQMTINGTLRFAPLPSEFQRWYREAKVDITSIFGDKFGHVQEFDNIILHINPTPLHPGSSHIDYIRDRKQDYSRMLDSADSLILSMLMYVVDHWEDDGQMSTLSTSKDVIPPSTNEVFIVHGRDEGIKNTVARFLEKLGLQPIVLAEQPSQGLTIIEKFEQHAQVAFAVVLLTPDDTGSLRDEDNTPNPRARQNVIFELGILHRTTRPRLCLRLDQGCCGDSIRLRGGLIHSTGRI